MLAYTLFCREDSGESQFVARRKLDDAVSNKRAIYVEKQKLKTDLSIIDEKLAKAEQEQLTREVDYEMFFSQNPKSDIKAIDKILFWRANSIREKEEALLRKKSEPVRIARLLKEKLEKDRKSLLIRIEELEKMFKASETTSQELENAWIGSVYRHILGMVHDERFEDALKSAYSLIDEHRNDMEIQALLWLTIELVRRNYIQNESEGSGKELDQENIDKMTDVSRRCIAIIHEHGEKLLSKTMHFVSSRRIAFAEDVPLASSEQFKSIRLYYVYQICLLLLDFEPLIDDGLPQRAAALVSAIEVARKIETMDCKPKPVVQSVTAKQENCSFDSLLRLAIRAMGFESLTSADCDGDKPTLSVGKESVTLRNIERGDFSRAYRKAEFFVADVVASLLGHCSILNGFADKFIALLENEAIDLLKENVNLLPVTALAYRSAGLELDNALINLLQKSKPAKHVWYALDSVLEGSHYQERMTQSPTGLFVIL